MASLGASSTQVCRATDVSRASLAISGNSLVSVRQSYVCTRHANSAVDAQSGRLMVIAKKRRSLAERFGRQPQPGPMPQVDPTDDTPRFVIFIKTKNVNIWYPLSMVAGGTTAKLMLSAMKWDLGKKLYEGTLTRNMGAVVYKDEKAIQATATRQYPMLKGASGFEYGYKLVDPKNPKAAVAGSGVVKIPPQEELKSVLDKAKDFFDSKLKGGSQEEKPVSDAKN